MVNRALSIFVLLALGLATQLFAEPVLELAWDDLLPKTEEAIDDPFADLSEDQLLDLGMVARIRFLLESEKISVDGTDAKEEKELVAKLAEQGIDVDELLSQRERVRNARQKRAERVDEGIDGKSIRLPGYMLPLKRVDGSVTEFLLVPWVGACIHTPPPPPNQMVHVSIPVGTENKGRFAAIWIEGRITLKPSVYELFLVDGKRDIKVAYTMELDSIDEYSSKESDTLAKVEIPEDLTGEHSWLQKMQNKISLMFTKTMTDIKDQRTSGALFVGLLTAFIYGVLHTLGPGHGKAIVVSYFVGEKGSLWRGVRMGGQIALFHVLSAIAVVLITDFAVRQATGKSPSDYRMVRLISYASIAAIGVWMLTRAIRSARVKPHHHHEHHDGCGCEHLAQPVKGVSGFLALAVGAVPCTGALLVLLFGVANDLLWPAIVMVISISLGMALALAAVGVAAILGRRFVDRKVGQDTARQHRVASGLRIASAAGVLCIGCALFALTWSGQIAAVPQASAMGTGGLADPAD
jgi:nickel/cobalt exporter